MGLRLKVGDKVAWVAYGWWGKKHYSGRVAVVVPAGKNLWDEMPSGVIPPHSLRNPVRKRQSYIIITGRNNRAHCPNVVHLRRADFTQEEIERRMEGEMIDRLRDRDWNLRVVERLTGLKWLRARGKVLLKLQQTSALLEAYAKEVQSDLQTSGGDPSTP